VERPQISQGLKYSTFSHTLDKTPEQWKEGQGPIGSQLGKGPIEIGMS